MTKPEMPTAADVMSRRLHTLRPEMSLASAMKILLRKDISGAPVVNEHGELVGILSERDCLRVAAHGEYTAEDLERSVEVAMFMTAADYTIPPETGLYSIADFFLTHPIRRLPVIDKGRLVGIVARRDVLRGIERMVRRRRMPQLKNRHEPKLYLSATDSSPDVLGQRLK
ncbi:MAG: CBS domain-containing protein [Gemmatimonadota bacterium]|nr:CBS domain-containing protein [Gemmatimonadota bacterium]